MSYFLCCLALAAMPAFGQTRDVAPVALFTHFQEPPSNAFLSALRQEVARIMAPLGLPLEWKSLDGQERTDVVSELAVVTFVGDCSTSSLLRTGSQTTPLGTTNISDGVVLPFTEIYCDRISRFLYKDLLRTDWRERDAVYGRAVARVLAHELFHVFAGTAHHGSEGVAKSAFTDRELVAERFQLETSEMRILRAGMKVARQQNGRLRSAASPIAGQSIFQESGCASCHGAAGEGTRMGPSLHAADRKLDLKTVAAKLTKDVMNMYSRIKPGKLSPPTLDDDEIADLASFLNGLN